MDRGAWQATVHGMAKSRTGLSDWTTTKAYICHHIFSMLELVELQLKQCSQGNLVCVYTHVSSVQFSRSVVSDSLWSHGLQHTRLPCLSPTPRIHPNSCPLSLWCHPTISSVIPFFLPPSVFPSIRVSSLHQVATILEFQLQHQSFQWIFRTDFL